MSRCWFWNYTPFRVTSHDVTDLVSKTTQILPVSPTLPSYAATLGKKNAPMAPLCKAPIPKWSKTMPKPTVCKRHQGGKRKAAGATKHSKSKVVVAKIPPQLKTQNHQLQNEGWKSGSGHRRQRTAWRMICSIASMNLSIPLRRNPHSLDLKVLLSACMLWARRKLWTFKGTYWGLDPVLKDEGVVGPSLVWIQSESGSNWKRNVQTQSRARNQHIRIEIFALRWMCLDVTMARKNCKSS